MGPKQGRDGLMFLGWRIFTSYQTNLSFLSTGYVIGWKYLDGCRSVYICNIVRAGEIQWKIPLEHGEKTYY